MNKEIIYIIGDVCNDIHYHGSYYRISPENPNMNVFQVSKKATKQGMASNVFFNLGNIHHNLFKHKNYVFLLEKNTLEVPEKHRFYDDFQMVFRYDINDITHDRFDSNDELNLTNVSYVIVSDYDKGYLSHSDVAFIGKCCRKNNVPCLIDSKKELYYEFFKDYDFIKLNEVEYNNNKDVVNNTNLYEKCIITLGENGCMFQGKQYPIPYSKPDKVYPEGCGDTFVAGFVLSYLNTYNIERSLNFGMEMSGKVISKEGVTTPF